jgi:Carboxypeptidase regulatory-like domain
MNSELPHPLHGFTFRAAWQSIVGGVLLMLIVWPAVLMGQSKSADRPCVFEGDVVSAETGDPIMGAEVIAAGVRQWSAETDASGHFCIRSVEPWRYYLRVVKDGFVTNYYGDHPPYRSMRLFWVSKGSAFTNLEVRLIPAAEIQGHVFDESDRPIAGVTVEAAEEGWEDGLFRLDPSQSAKTKRDGSYLIQRLAPGNYLLRAIIHGNPLVAKASGAKNDESSDGFAYAPMYYPASLEFRGATVVNLRAGDDRGPFDFHLHPVQAYSVKGEVVDERHPGSRQCSAEITVAPQDPNAPDYDLGTRHRLVNRCSFDFHGIPPGSYQLAAFSGRLYMNLAGRAMVMVRDADVDGARLRMMPDYSLTGHLGVSGTPADPSGWRITLRVHGPAYWGGRSSRVSQDGSFNLQHVNDETAKLEISGCRNCYVKSVELGGVPCSSQDVNITREAAAGGMQVTVGTDGAQVTGLVVGDNQQPAARAYVVVIPETPTALTEGFFRTAFTDQRGQFGIGGLPPGEYLVFAWPSPQYAAFEYPSFVEQYREDGFSVTLMAGQIRNIQIPLLPTPPPGP